MEPLPKEDLLRRMSALADEMRNVAVQMDYYGGFDARIVQHAGELAGAAGILEDWIENMETNPEEEENHDDL
jgi:hypothetical protein